MATEIGGERQPGARSTGVRYEVPAFACTLSMITDIDRVCFGVVDPKCSFTAFAIASSRPAAAGQE